MAIGSATERNGSVSVYDERGRVIFIRSGTLMGYTGATVTIRNGSSVTTYNDRGAVKFIRSA